MYGDVVRAVGGGGTVPCGAEVDARGGDGGGGVSWPSSWGIPSSSSALPQLLQLLVLVAGGSGGKDLDARALVF